MEAGEYTIGVFADFLPGDPLSIPSDAPDRLTEIERLLAQTTYVATANDGAENPVVVHLADVPAARIRELTRILQQRSAEANDEIDVLAMRLLLNDYLAAIAHLRAVARVAASLVDGAAVPVKQADRFLRADEKKRQKQSAGTDTQAADDQPT
jgi:hypothetical protein